MKRTESELNSGANVPEIASKLHNSRQLAMTPSTENILVKNVLLVRDPWASMILSGFKTWEIRGTKLGPEKLTTVAIAKSGEKGLHRIYGVVNIVDVLGPLSLKDMRDNLCRHRDPLDTRKMPYTKTYAWVLESPRLLKKPLDYDYKDGWVIWGVGTWAFRPTDFVSAGKYVTMPSPDPEKRQQFLESLTEDLSFFGFQVSTANDHGIGMTFIRIPEFDAMSNGALRDTLHEGYSRLQEKNRRYFSSEWERMNSLVEKKSLLAKTPVSLEQLNLEIRPVRNKEDKDIHWFLRMHQNLPSARTIGRSMDALVYHVPKDSVSKDAAQTEHIFGMIGLGSASYNSGGRDTLFGWNDPSEQSRKAKQSALRSILQINCLLLAPPYNDEHCRGCKLLAMAVFSSEIVCGYEQNYGSPMLAAISTAGFGTQAYIFHRIATGALGEHADKDLRLLLGRNQADAHDRWPAPSFERDARKKNNNYVFYREAITSDVCFNIVSEATKELSKSYCESSGSIKRMRGTQQALDRALHFAGIHQGIFRVAPRGIYVGMLSNESISSLSLGRTEECSGIHLSWDSLVKWWKYTELRRLNAKPKGDAR